MMEGKAFSISLEKHPLISMKVIPGHFTTSNSHVSHYLDVSSLKSNAQVARDVARVLANPYLSSTLVDTIVCIERTEVIGAYLAEELSNNGMSIMNENTEIHVITPISNNIGSLYFQGSMVKHISNRNILLLTSYISVGQLLDNALDCISYYRGKIAGISALFLASLDLEQKINTLFTSEDVPGYKIFSPRKCEMCQAGQSLDALISSEGYTKI